VEDGEQRWHAIGVLDGRGVVAVVHTYRAEGVDEIIRIVSARRADAQERKHYAEASEKQDEDILAITGQRDEDIDYSDIPPIREIPADAVHGRFYRGHAICLTDELHAYLSNIAMRRGVSLNDLVNNVLSQEVARVEALK
jgi:hypothetical protein